MPPGVRTQSKREIEDEVVRIVASSLRCYTDGVTVVNYPVVDRGLPGVLVSVEPVGVEDGRDEVTGMFLVTVQRISTAVGTGEGESGD